MLLERESGSSYSVLQSAADSSHSKANWSVYETYTQEQINEVCMTVGKANELLFFIFAIKMCLSCTLDPVFSWALLYDNDHELVPFHA